MPNITVIGNASTCTEKIHNVVKNTKNYDIVKIKHCIKLEDCVTYIVQHDTHKNVQRNAEKVHDGAPGLLGNVLRSHLHNGWPEYANATLKSTEAKKLNAASE